MANGGCFGGFFSGTGGFGLGEAVGMVGGAVARGYLFAVAEGGDAGGVAVAVGLDGDGGSLSDGVVEGEVDGLTEGVGDIVATVLTGDGFAASAARGTQGKCRYEGSR